MSRRRNYSSDDEDSRPAKRRRPSETGEIEDRLESLISRVGEKSSSSLESNLEGLASVLEADLPNYKQQIIKILCECVVSMPEKLTVYTTLVGLLNAKNYNAGGEFVEHLLRNLKDALKTNRFEYAKVMMRFLADLVNCHVIVAASVISMFDNMIEVTLEDNIPQVRSDCYVHLVLCALPWCGRELYEKRQAEFHKLLQTIQSYIDKRQKIYLPALRVWSSDVPHPQEEYLDCLWAQIKQLKANEWEERHITRPYLAFDSVLCEALQHTLQEIIPPSHHEEAVYPLPSVIFRMFDYTDVPEGPVLPGHHAIERYLIEDQLEQILHINHCERKDCAASLLNFPTKNKIPLNYMIVEVVFGQLFRLPRAPYLEIFYGSLLIELCKLQPSSMPQVLAQATEMLFERVDTMNTSCFDRFCNWFAYHLSNFQFRWSWEDWAVCLNMDPELPKPKAVREILYKTLRLSYHQRLVDTTPDDFAPLLPAKPEPVFKFQQEGEGSLPGTMHAHKLIAAIRSKCSPQEAVDILKELPNPRREDDGTEPSHNPLRTDVFLQSLLFLGAKSISHTFAGLAKFHMVLQALAETEEGQMGILTATHALWQHNQQKIVILVDKYLKTQIVECATVANWIFSSDMAKDFTCNYVWEILHSTILKMIKHVTKLQREVEEANDRRDAAQRKIRDGMDDDIREEDIPSEALIESMEEDLEQAQSKQKNLFLIIFQRFIIILTEHLADCETNQQDYNTPWYKWAIERLQHVFLQHHEHVYKYISTLETLIFTSVTDIHILQVFQQFCALRS